MNNLALSDKKSQSLVYYVEIRISKTDIQKIAVVDKLVIGSAKEADIQILESRLSEKHFTFRVNNNVLSLHYLGDDNKTKFGRQVLERGKMYLLDKGDKIKTPDFLLTIYKEPASDSRILVKEGLSDANEELSDLTQVHTGALDLDELMMANTKHDKATAKKPGQTKRINTNFNNKQARAKTLAKYKKESQVSSISSFFKRPKSDRKLAPKMSGKNIKLNKIKRTTLAPIPGVFFRLLSLATDFAITYFSYSFLIKIPQFHSYFQKYSEIGFAFTQKSITPIIFKFAQQYIPQYDNLIKSNITLYHFQLLFLFALFQLIFHLVLSVPPLYFIAGVKDRESNFLMKRLQGVARAIIGILTLPFLVFDLPLLVGKRSLKEFITRSHLSYSSNIKGKIKLLLLLHFIALIIYYAPIFSSDYFRQNILYQNITTNLTKTRAKNSQQIKDNSTLFNYNINASFDKSYLMTPFISATKDRSQIGINFWNKQSKGQLDFTVIDKIPSEKILKMISLNNPLLKYFYPKTERFIKSGKKKFSSFDLQNELFNMLKDSFLLNFKSIHHVFKSSGPILTGQIKLHQLLSQKMSLFNVQSIDIFKIKKRTLLRIKSRPSLKSWQWNLLEIHPKDVIVYQMSFNNTLKNPQDFMSQFLYLSKIGVRSKFKKKKDSLFALSDLFEKVTQDKKITKRETTYALKYLKTKVKYLRKKRDSASIDHLFKLSSAGLNDLDKIFAVKQNKKYSYFVKSIVKINKMLLKPGFK